jgi:hypothetical protein
VAVITRRGHGFSLGGTRLLAVALFVLAAGALGALRGEPDGQRLPAARAEQASLADAKVRGALAGGYTRVRTRPLDDRLLRVSFFDGPRAVAETAIAPDGRVRALIVYDGRHARMGSDVGQRPAVLLVLLALFLVATLRLPLRRRENLDAVALAACAGPIVLLNERYLELSVVAAAVLLAYLGWRCLGVALGPPAAQGGERWLTERLPARVTGLLVAGAAAGLALLAIPGGLASDVGFASLAGATKVLDGTLPYGNLPTGELIHGDTYPLLAYLAYLPAAVLSPVRDGFDTVEGALWVATAFAFASALALGRIGGRRLALAFLAFAPVMVAASSGSNDVVAAALVAGALAWGTRAGPSSGALAAAAWVKLAPFALLPMWVARQRARGAWRALAAAATVSGIVLAAVLVLGGVAGLADMVRALSFQSERGSLMSVWALLDLPVAQVAFQAAVLTGIVLAAIRVWRDGALAADPRRMAALGAAILLAVQLAANHWSATYLAWVFPLLAVALLTPSRAPASPRRAETR